MMGLDDVEMFMALEEEFGIKIPDKEACKCETPRDVIDLVCSMVCPDDQVVCSSLRAFHAVRRGLVSVCGAPRGAVKRASLLADFADLGDARDWWPKLKEACEGRDWPALVSTRRGVLFEVTVAYTAAAAAYGLAWLAAGFVARHPSIWPLWRGASREENLIILPAMAAMAALVGTALLLDSLRRRGSLPRWYHMRVPRKIVMVRDLMPHVRAAAKEPGPDRDAVARRVREIVMQILSLTEAQYSEDADFYKDLGMG